MGASGGRPRRRKRVLLLTAPRPRPDYTPLHFGDNRPPQGLGYVAAWLERAGHEIRIVDLYAFTWRYGERETKVESPWRRHADVTTGRNWARTMDGDLRTVEGHARGGFAQNNSDGTIAVGSDRMLERMQKLETLSGSTRGTACNRFSTSGRRPHAGGPPTRFID